MNRGFRLWDKTAGKLIKDTSIESDGRMILMDMDGGLVEISEVRTFLRNDPKIIKLDSNNYILMFKFKEKDMNGSDIFQGDICIRYNYYYGELKPYDIGYFDVKHRLFKHFVPMKVIYQTMTWSDFDKDSGFEVIGNIYENGNMIHHIDEVIKKHGYRIQ